MWAFGKKVLNSTLGTKDFKSLDKIITNKKMMPSDDVLLSVLSGEESFSESGKFALTAFKSIYKGSFTLKGEMYATSASQGVIDVIVNGVVKASIAPSTTGSWHTFEKDVDVAEGDEIVLMLTKTDTNDFKLRKVSLCAKLIDDIGVRDNSSPIQYTLAEDGTFYWCAGSTNSSMAKEAYILDDIGGVPVEVVQGFRSDAYLETVRLGEKVKTIMLSTFANTAIKSIDLPASVTTINSGAFDYCDKLKTVIFKGTPTGTISANAFRNCPNLTNIYVPWSQGAVANAPWGAENATIHYNSEV